MALSLADKVRKSEAHMRPVLPINQQMDVGYVGTIGDDGSFRYRGSISTMLGVSLGRQLPISKSDAKFTITSGSGVSVDMNATVDASGPFGAFAKGKGKALVKFKSSDGFFMAINGLKVVEIAEPETLNLAMLRAYRDGRWSKDFVYVYQVGIVDSFSVILAHDADTEVLLSASANVTGGKLADADLAAGFKFTASSSSVTQLVGGKRIRAFFNAYSVDDSWFAGPKVRQFVMAPDVFATRTDGHLPSKPRRKTA